MECNFEKSLALSLLLGVAGLFGCHFPTRLTPGEEARMLSRRGQIWAGAAKDEIVPPWFVSLGGYGKRMGRALEGVGDRPCVRALWLRREGEADGLAIVSADLLIIPEELRRRAIEKMGEGRPKGLLLAATHTHSSMGNYDPSVLAQALALGGFREPALDFLAERIAKAVMDAKTREHRAQIGAAWGDAPGLSSHRRDATLSVDAELAVIRIADESGKPIARLISFAAHPTVLPASSRLLSGDFPGYLCSEIERRLGGTALFLNGACAEIDPNAPGGGRTLEAARKMGEALGDAVQRLDGEIRLDSEAEIGFVSQVVALPERHASHAIVFPFGYLLAPWILPQLPQEARLQVFTLGRTRLATFPCDFGVQLGRELRRDQAEMVIPVSYADGFVGYAIDEASYERNWYETRMSFYGAALGSFLVEHSRALLASL